MLRGSRYRRLWLASLISRTGDAFQFVALPLYVYATTRSPLAVAGLVFVEGGGLILGAMLAQFLVDRQPPKTLLISLDGGRAVATLALAAFAGYPTALMVALILAVATGCFSPLVSAVVPRVVDVAELPTANALQWTASVVPQLVGAPLGGVLVAVASPRLAFGVNAASFALSAMVLLGLPALRPLGGIAGPWGHLGETFRAVRTTPGLPPLLLVQALAAVSVGSTSALLVVLAEHDYGLGAAGYGAWLTAIGVGAVLGPLLVPAVFRLHPPKAVAAAYVVRGAGDVALGVLNQGIAGGILLGIYGLGTSSGMVAYQTLVQRQTPDAIRGRVFALLDAVWQTARLVSIAAGGFAAVHFGARVVFIAGGMLLVLAGLVGSMTLGNPDRAARRA